jgi:hypothetical protein
MRKIPFAAANQAQAEFMYTFRAICASALRAWPIRADINVKAKSDENT